MKITAVETFHVAHQLTNWFGGSGYEYHRREALFLKIATDTGLVGWGETEFMPGLPEVIRQQYIPRLIGQDPCCRRPLWRELWGANYGNGMALGAVDLALEDLRGKSWGKSLAEMYGGPLRDRVPAYASAVCYTAGRDPEVHYPEDALALAQRGFQALKVRIGRLPVARDLEAVAKIREAVGPQMKVAVDANGAYTFHTALDVGRELKQLDVYWFEEPLPQAQYGGYEALTDALEIAVAGGEVCDSRGAARDLIARRAVDILQTNMGICGGFQEALFIAEMARLWNVWYVPHSWSGGIVLAATAHLLSLLPPGTWSHSAELSLLELDVSDNPFRERILKNPVEVRDGWVTVPTGPGLGVEIDEDVLREYVVA